MRLTSVFSFSPFLEPCSESTSFSPPSCWFPPNHLSTSVPDSPSLTLEFDNLSSQFSRKTQTLTLLAQCLCLLQLILVFHLFLVIFPKSYLPPCFSLNIPFLCLGSPLPQTHVFLSSTVCCQRKLLLVVQTNHPIIALAKAVPYNLFCCQTLNHSQCSLG